jgi:hypothetical protein
MSVCVSTPTRRDSTREKTFTNNINYNLNKTLKTLAKRKKQSNGLSTYPR